MASVSITRRTTTKGKARYVVRYRLNGADAPRHGGSFKTKRLAEIRADTLRAELAANPTLEALPEAAVWAIEPDVRPPGWVYAVRSGSGLTKIGYTIAPMRRLAGLQTGSGERLELLRLDAVSGMDVERALHAKFAAHRKHGEWFDLPADWQLTWSLVLWATEHQETS